MNTPALTIRGARARAVNVPLARPVRTAVGSIPSAPLVLIDVMTEEGVVGRSYLFGYKPVALSSLVRLIEDIAVGLKGEPVAPLDRMRQFDRDFRLLGWQGLVGTALSGLDMAFWDALAQAAQCPLVRLLGGEPCPLPAYDSFGIIDPGADEPAILASVKRGFRAIKIKLGESDLERDVATVRDVRQMIGEAVTLMVDYNQSLDPPEACRRIARLAEFDIHWVEEPVPAEDLQGHARVRATSPIRVQTGENWWFPRGMAAAIAAEASDFAMLDVMKIGGVTGWLKAAALAEAASLPVSSHVFVEASAHLLAVTPTRHWLEHLDTAAPILLDPVTPQNGTVKAKGPGLGIAWNEDAVDKYML